MRINGDEFQNLKSHPKRKYLVFGETNMHMFVWIFFHYNRHAISFDFLSYTFLSSSRLPCVTTLNFHILRVATNVSCSSIMRKYNSYMNIVDNVNLKKNV